MGLKGSSAVLHERVRQRGFPQSLGYPLSSKCWSLSRHVACSLALQQKKGQGSLAPSGSGCHQLGAQFRLAGKLGLASTSMQQAGLLRGADEKERGCCRCLCRAPAAVCTDTGL